MIIQCEQCRTKFRLDDSRVKDAGVKVRCAKCKHIFTVRKELADIPQEIAPQAGFAAMLDQTAGTGEQSPATTPFMTEHAGTSAATTWDVHASPFEGSIAENSSETAGLVQSEPAVEEPAFAAAVPAGLGSQVESDWEKALKPDATPFPGIENDSVDQELPTTPPEADKTGLAPEAAADSDLFPFLSPDKPAEGISQPPVFPEFTAETVVAEEKTEEPKTVEADTFSFAAAGTAPEVAATAVKQPPEEPPAAQITAAAPLDGQQPVAAPAAPEPAAPAAQEELPPLSISSRRKQSPLVKILLVVLLLVAAAALYFQYGGALLSKFYPKSATEQGSITLRSIDASYVKNESAGELLVISGEAVNNFTTPRSAIQVKGVVYGNNNQILVSKNAFSGNIIPKDQLATMPLDKIEAAMANQFALDNLEVAPGKTVPFMIVISKLPEGAANFGALPAGSAAVTKKK